MDLTQRVFHNPVEAAPRYQARMQISPHPAEPNDDAPDDSRSPRVGATFDPGSGFKAPPRATRPAGGDPDRVNYGESSTVDDVSDRKTPTGPDRRLLFTSRWSFPVQTSLRPSSPTSARFAFRARRVATRVCPSEGIQVLRSRHRRQPAACRRLTAAAGIAVLRGLLWQRGRPNF